MVLCAAYNCNVRSGEKIPMCFFPKNPKLCKIWVDKLRCDSYWPSKHSKLCIKHFTNDQFKMDLELARAAGYKKVDLKDEAVPTIFDYTPKSTTGKRKYAENSTQHRPKTARSSMAVVKRRALANLQNLHLDVLDSQTQVTDEVPCADIDTDVQSKDMSTDPIDDQPAASFDNFTQTTYGLIPRRHAAIQTNIYVEPHRVPTRHIQTQTDETRPTDVDFEESFLSVEDDLRDPDWTPVEDIDDNASIRQDQPQSPAKERKFIVFESSLDKLFKCCRFCGEQLNCSKTVKGTFVNIQAHCLCCGESVSWDSQPQESSMPLGNLIVAAAILFSGSSRIKSLNMFSHASIEMISIRTYHNIQTLYLVPTITSVWQSQQLRLCDSIKDSGEPIRVGGDARCCSPGHTAKYGSYSLMDLSSSKILDIQLVQSNEVKNSYSMELEGLKRCLAFMMENDIHLSHLVTDRHSQVKSYMKKERPEIEHWFDCWHVAKGIYKKLEKKGKKKACKTLLDWARSISNHLYWCAASSGGDDELVHEKWASILNHVTNVHEGHGEKFRRCLHGPLEDRAWIKRDSAAFKELESVVNGRLLKQDVKKLSPAEQTSGLEAFHKVVCHFAPKLVHYFHPQMEARLYLAAMHFNENGNRPQSTTANGVPKFTISYPKSRKGEGVAKEVKVNQTFDYVQELMEEVLISREHLSSYSRAREYLQLDKARPEPLSHSTPHRPKQQIIDSHVSKFNRC